MAIRLSKLGGTDFTEEGLKPTTDLVPTLEGVLSVAAVGVAENSYKILQVADVFTNGANTAADEFTDATGTNNTVNTGSSTAAWGANSYKLTMGVGTAENTGSFTPYSQLSDITINMTAASAGIINQVQIKGTTSGFGMIMTITQGSVIMSKTFNLTVSINTLTINPADYTSFISPGAFSINFLRTSGSGVMDYSLDNATYSGTLFSFTNQKGFTNVTNAYSYKAITTFTSGQTVICDSSTITLDGTEKALIVSTPDSTWDTGSTITVIASDGTTSTSAQTINSTSKNTGVFSISTLSSGTLKLTYTLATSDTTKTPTLKGYGVYVIR